ncbi:hypothetical protein CHS0354_013476 [Potamilus streckersoni]|uniref:Uncharacterized protein n=1 Tax=Potamilus streckersoni TaxID=2493646 RepID=A0AAE0T8E8_9BIVA|nr:hypothetical protein CHS0354_013476 [Potamilus streckersoni]
MDLISATMQTTLNSQKKDSGSCTDKISNCNSYGMGVCSNPAYSQWVTDNCKLYCGKCGPLMGSTTGSLSGTGPGAMTGPGTGSVGTGVMTGTGTGGTSTGTGMYSGQQPGNFGTGMGTGTGGAPGTLNGGTGTMTGGSGTGAATGGCMDKAPNCAQLDQMQHICSNTGAHIYAQTNCAHTCNLCPSTGCADKLTNCAAYGSTVCTDATYAGWVTDNCAKSCNKCSGQIAGGTGLMTGGTGSGTGGMTGHQSGCTYKAQAYQQGQSWNDDCTLKCTCTDGSSGQYTCNALCVTWQLPSVCTLSPPAPGKCCTTPNCPAGYSIQYPPGYQEN